ncbi:MAG: hypothetical protein Q9195_005655 [Heterodermia aff. obscurata]
MQIPNLTFLLLVLLLQLYVTTSAVASRNALALIEAQPDLKLIGKLIRRDPELVKLYSTAKNATVVVAIDSSFPITDPNNIIYSNRAANRAALQDSVIRGLHPTSRITTKPIYPSTELTDARFVDTTRGRAASKLVEIDGRKNVDTGAGTRANITQGNLRFTGGILHKLNHFLDPPASFFSIAARLNITSISRLPPDFVGAFEIITSAPDTTLFAITNKAYEALLASQPDATFDQFVDTLGYYVVTPGVYFEKDFTGKSVKTLNGAKLRLSGFGTGTVKANDAVVVRSDVFSTNGVLHILDRYIAEPLTVFISV